MKLNVYLAFDGRCKEAFEFYQTVLGGNIEAMIPHAGTPAEGSVPPEWLDKIMHARLSIGDNLLMGSDAPPNHHKKPQAFSVNIGIDDQNEAERIFHALAENGSVMMPIAPTFWATRFGMCTDRFGIPWMINCPQTGGNS
jgi:PhnB protein